MRNVRIHHTGDNGRVTVALLVLRSHTVESIA